MSREKQIDEIAKDLCQNDFCSTECHAHCRLPANSYCWDVEILAEKLYNAGYRKQSEGEWVYKFTLDGDRFYECSVCGRQEVVNCLCKERNLAEDRPYCHCGAKMKGGAE